MHACLARSLCVRHHVYVCVTHMHMCVTYTCAMALQRRAHLRRRTTILTWAHALILYVGSGVVLHHPPEPALPTETHGPYSSATSTAPPRSPWLERHPPASLLPPSCLPFLPCPCLPSLVPASPPLPSLPSRCLPDSAFPPTPLTSSQTPNEWPPQLHVVARAPPRPAPPRLHFGL